MRRITLLVSILLCCFLTCGALQADGAAPKPPQKHHQVGKKKPKPYKASSAGKKKPNPHSKEKAAAKGAAQNNPKKQVAKATIEKDTVIVDEVGGAVIATPGRHHEPQAVSDAQLRQAQRLLLTPPPTLEKLQQARALLVRANWTYDGHRSGTTGGRIRHQ